MIEIRRTTAFDKWFEGLEDDAARGRILSRIDRLILGNFGDARSIGEGVSELRIHYGPGYRVYFVREGATLVVLLGGGDKRTQKRDIVKAREMARQLRDEKNG